MIIVRIKQQSMSRVSSSFLNDFADNVLVFIYFVGHLLYLDGIPAPLCTASPRNDFIITIKQKYSLKIPLYMYINQMIPTTDKCEMMGFLGIPQLCV